MLPNAYFLAKSRFDTAENEPAKKLQNFPNYFPNFANPNPTQVPLAFAASVGGGLLRASSARSRARSLRESALDRCPPDGRGPARPSRRAGAAGARPAGRDLSVGIPVFFLAVFRYFE